MLEIRYGQPITPDQFQQITRLIVHTYGEDIFTCPGLAQARIRRCPDCFVCAYDGEEMVGEFSTYPVSHAVWERALETPVLMDDDIDPDYILPLSREGPNELMVFDLAVDADYRHHGVADLLLEG